MTPYCILRTACLIHDRLVHIRPTSSPSSVYKILIILHCHGMCPHAMGETARLILAIATVKKGPVLKILYEAGRWRGQGRAAGARAATAARAAETEQTTTKAHRQPGRAGPPGERPPGSGRKAGLAAGSRRAAKRHGAAQGVSSHPACVSR